jgi:hypothetical protein
LDLPTDATHAIPTFNPSDKGLQSPSSPSSPPSFIMCTSQDMSSSIDASFNGEASSQSSLPDHLVLVNHPMVTRSKSGVIKQNPRMHFSLSLIFLKSPTM